LSYRIEIKRSAAKALKKIPKANRKRIVDKIDSLAESPPNPDTTKMKGNNPLTYLEGAKPLTGQVQ
jgi:mRNA interferase RelE/StbE